VLIIGLNISVLEGGLGTGTEGGRIEKCKVDEADDFLDGSDPSKIIKTCCPFL
jgi:hypothetical protein